MDSNVDNSFLDRKMEKPDIAIKATIKGVHQPDGYTAYRVAIEGEPDVNYAAKILRAAARILTDPESTDVDT